VPLRIGNLLSATEKLCLLPRTPKQSHREPPGESHSASAPASHATSSSDGSPPASPSGVSYLPSIELPKGGGAIRGIGEKFAVSAVTGTASLSVPLPVGPGRSGFAPQLALSYDSGAGNGPFGLGRQLALPAITRKTDRGLPRYEDAEDSDIFIAMTVVDGASDTVFRLPADTPKSDPALKTGAWSVAVAPGSHRIFLASPTTGAYRSWRWRDRLSGKELKGAACSSLR
jgi:hypothetical protein